MKKATVLILTLVTVIVVSVFLANANEDPIKQISDQYSVLSQKIEKDWDSLDKKEMMRSYSEMFGKIAEGDRERAGEYAQLLRDITRDIYKFDDSEVFGIAADISRLYSDVADGKAEVGVQDVKIEPGDKDEMILTIDYIDALGYSVRAMEDDERVLRGDGYVDYDGSMGKHRIAVTVAAKPSGKLTDKYSTGETYVIDIDPDTKIYVRIDSLFEDDLGVYIGSDKPLSVDSEGHTDINRPCGSIELHVHIGNE